MGTKREVPLGSVADHWHFKFLAELMGDMWLEEIMIFIYIFLCEIIFIYVYCDSFFYISMTLTVYIFIFTFMLSVFERLSQEQKLPRHT